jgi:FkbM family methyltransferase
MNLREKTRQVSNIVRHSRKPLPLLQDLLRTKRADYIAECKGMEFELNAYRHEWYAVYETIINEDYLQHGIAISPGDTVVDVGAGFGTFALLAAQKAGPEGQIIAYEPDPDICARAHRNAMRNGLRNVRMNNEAIGGTDDEGDLLLQAHSHRNAMFDCVDGQTLRTDRKIRVQVRSISSVIDSIDGPINLLKLHCEGAEYEILDHVDSDRCQKIKQIALETHHIDGRDEQELIDRLLYLDFCPVHKPPMIFAVRTELRE